MRNEFLLNERSHKLLGLGVVAEGLADVSEAIDISGSKHETSAKLKWVLAKAVLAHADGFGAFARPGIIPSQQMKDVGLLERQRAVRLALIVNQQGKRYPGLLTEVPGITDVAKANRHQPGAALAEPLLVFAQLRDVLTAEDSAVVTEEDHNGRRIGP